MIVIWGHSWAWAGCCPECGNEEGLDRAVAILDLACGTLESSGEARPEHLMSPRQVPLEAGGGRGGLEVT